MAVGVLLLAAGAAGCGGSYALRSANDEFAEQVENARENARERDAAHHAALQVQQEMGADLRRARHPSAGCKVEYAAVAPRQGIAPIACGNLASAWSLTVDHGYLRCEPSLRPNFNRVIFTAPDGSEYAVSRAARGAGYRGIDPIRRRDPSGNQADLEPLLERGLALCSGA